MSKPIKLIFYFTLILFNSGCNYDIETNQIHTINYTKDFDKFSQYKSLFHYIWNSVIVNGVNDNKARIVKDSYRYKDKLIKEYKKKSVRIGFNFNTFRNDKLDDLEDIYLQKEGIIWKTFHEFVLTDPDFENNVNGVL